MMADVAVQQDISPPERGPIRKRRRVVVSCTECHRRKQKCDRDLPCANCRARNKQASCTYETGAPTIRERVTGSSNVSPPSAANEKPSSRSDGQPLSSQAASWGYGQTGTSTIGLLRRIEMTHPSEDDESPSQALCLTARNGAFAVKERYKSLVRQLPPNSYQDKLIAMFMHHFNWQYYTVTPDAFQAQLDEWRSLPFNVLSSQGPKALSPDMRVFPALLFQMLAIAILLLPSSAGTNDVEGEELFEGDWNTLKYAADMTWEDLGNDYSESGMAIIRLFGKEELSLTGVVAQVQRATFLKYIANIVESWHTVAETIRDAQEIGMHSDALDPKPVDDSIEAALENQWLIQRRRSVYMVLVSWDMSMAGILGRPGVLNPENSMPSLPLDTAAPKDTRKQPVVPRDDSHEPPTPLLKSMWFYHLCAPLRGIANMEKDGAYPKDWNTVHKIHADICELEDRKPAMFRVENPDTRWDDLEGMHWVKGMRYYMCLLHHVHLMVLHRRYIFHRAESRKEALKASVIVLELHKGMMESLPPVTWRNHMLFFGTFDALVQLATIFIVFPKEHPEILDHAKQHFDWAIQRFTAMAERNPIARSALGVLRAIQAKFAKAVSSVATGSTSSASVLSVGPGTASPSTSGWNTLNTTPTSNDSSDKGNSSLDPGPVSAAGRGAKPSPSHDTDRFGVPSSSTTPVDGWRMPAAGVELAPMFPVSELIYKDLMAMPETGENGMLPPTGDTPALDGMEMWQFGGGFGEDTVWQFLNQY